jgi:hypothetical protein
MQHGPFSPGPAEGNLPVAVDIEGLGGGRSTRWRRAQEVWNWQAPDVVIVNLSDETIVCRVWLVAYVRALVGTADLKRVPNEVVSLDPRGTVRVTLDFQMELWDFDEDAKLDPGRPKELLFLEIGASQRQLRLPFSTEPFAQVAKEGTP